jgi:murein L,D-transpeptidase YcbB/YkuD
MLMRLLLTVALLSSWASSDSHAVQTGERSGLLQDVAAVVVLPGSPPAAPYDRLAGISPYTRLAAAIDTYQDIAALGGWVAVPAGQTLRLGSKGPGVVALRNRLWITDDLTTVSERPEMFDHDLMAAVRAFQARHGLEQDGVVGRRTLQALNVPVQRRLASMRLNLARQANWEDTWGGRYIAVNSAAARYRYVEMGRLCSKGRSSWAGRTGKRRRSTA